MPKLVKFWVSQTHWSYAQIIFLVRFDSLNEDATVVWCPVKGTVFTAQLIRQKRKPPKIFPSIWLTFYLFYLSNSQVSAPTVTFQHTPFLILTYTLPPTLLIFCPLSLSLSLSLLLSCPLPTPNVNDLNDPYNWINWSHWTLFVIYGCQHNTTTSRWSKTSPWVPSHLHSTKLKFYDLCPNEKKLSKRIKVLIPREPLLLSYLLHF